MLPYLVAVCPTYRRPRMLANLLACWEAQEYPAHHRYLLMLEDGTPCGPQHGHNWSLHTSLHRFPSLPAKYNHLGSLAVLRGADAIVVMEDDDVYLPGYLPTHAEILHTCDYSKPSRVLSDYPREIVEEAADGRFHASIAFRVGLFQRIGGWPRTKRADFDQQMISTLRHYAISVGDPCTLAPPQYVFRWHTGHYHGQGAMRSPADEGWYGRINPDFPPVAPLVPEMDEGTRRIMARVACDVGPQTPPAEKAG